MNLKDLAAHLEVAVSTVSRVLAGRGAEFRISAETQRRILEAAAEHGVRADELGRSLRLKITRTLGLVVPDISNVFFATLARAVEHRARQAGYLVLLADSQENTETEAQVVQSLLSRRIDGLLLAPVGGDGRHLLPLLSPATPVIQMDRLISSLNTSGVISSNAEGAHEAVRLLAELGHRRIACIQARGDSSVIQERLRGFREAMTELSLDPSFVVGDAHSQSRAREATHALLSGAEPPTALLTLTNQLALGALEAARDLSISVPDQLSIITFDEQPWASLLSPPLTTIAQPLEEMGALAVENLLRLIENGGSMTREPLGQTLPTRLIQRGSTARWMS
jgi:LacI family transcriptional regulator